MNKEELKKILPHREPMLLLDEVVAKNNIAAGKYLVRGDEFFLQGHFPDREGSGNEYDRWIIMIFPKLKPSRKEF